MRVKAKVVLGLLISILSTYNVQAANISDINVDNWDILDDDIKESVSARIKDIPNEIFEYYNECGGRVSFTDNAIIKDGYPDDTLMGIYWHDSHDIEVSILSEYGKTNAGTTLAHEFGHFIYYRTYKFWSDESKDELKYEFEYFWGPYHKECLDEPETFAVLYAMWRGDHVPYISKNCENMIEESENICINIYKDLNSKSEPGVISDEIADRVAKNIVNNTLEK